MTLLVSCQSSLALPSDLVTDQRRNGNERNDRADDDRFSDNEEDRVLRGIGEVCVAASRLEGAMAFLAMTMQSWSDEKYCQVQSRSGEVIKAFEALVPRTRKVRAQFRRPVDPRRCDGPARSS